MELEVEIQHVGLMGQGVGQDGQGNLYFVPGALPGDKVKARPIQETKRYRDADLIEITRPSPDRREATCSVFQECGGCDWLHWEYPAQLKAKQEMLQHVLERSGWLPDQLLPIVSAEKTLAYRNRIQLHSDGERLGFYRRRSHTIVDIEQCPVADPRLNARLPGLREELRGLGPRKVELTVDVTGQVRRFDNGAHAALGFTQIHEEQNNALKRVMAAWINQAGSKKVLELYCGNGNLTFSYAGGLSQVVAVESSEIALNQARQADPNQNIHFLKAHIDGRLKRRLPPDFRHHYDTLLLDPPRAGAQGSLEPLLHDELQTILYVSCSPVAFTKDVQCLKDGFRFVQVQAIDMFPQTRHIEFVAQFSRLS